MARFATETLINPDTDHDVMATVRIQGSDKATPEEWQALADAVHAFVLAIGTED